MFFSLDGLNPEQRKAAEKIQGPLLILAGAGSGKTRTITYRMGHMVQNLYIDPTSILAVSFTNKAAGEMKERLVSLIGKKAKKIHVATFHSLGVRMLREDIQTLGYQKRFSIYDQNDQMSLIRQALKSYRSEKKFDRKEILSKISYLKNHGISHSEFAQSSFFNPENPYDLATECCYHYYQDKLLFYNAIDFDDILYLTEKMLGQNPKLQEKYSKRYQYIMIDEYQDTNPLQLKMIRHLTTAHDNLCVVGDDDQAIYAFRGADIKNILEFEKHYPQAQTIKLETNYRSHQPILDLANHVIKENKMRKEKWLQGISDSQEKPYLWACGDSEHEAQVMIEEVKSLHSNGTQLKDIAWLYRSNTQTNILEEELRLAAIPYQMLGGQKLFDKKEVKDILAYLSVLVNPYDEISLRRILNVPSRGIGKATLQKYISKSSEIKKSLFKTMELYPALDPQREGVIKYFVGLMRSHQTLMTQEGLSQCLESLIKHIDYKSFIADQYDSPTQAELRQKDIDFFISSAERFEKQNPGVEARVFLEKMLLQDSQETKEPSDQEKKEEDKITLMTLHSSKGLEFDHVFLIGVEEELLPHKKTVQLGEDLSEERRLCYVGITRAKKRLIMTYCKERQLFGKMSPRHVSRFIQPLLSSDLITHYDRTTFGHMTPSEAENHKKAAFADMMALLD